MSGEGRSCRALLLVSLAVCSACDSGPALPEPVPAPVVESIEPPLLPAADSSALLVLRGKGFQPALRAYWDGSSRDVDLQSETSATVQLEDGDASTVGSFPLALENAGGPRANLSFIVGFPAPTANALDPDRAVAGSGDRISVTMEGTGFLEPEGETAVHWDGEPVRTVVEGPSRLTFHVGPSALRHGARVPVQVVNRSPGGGASGRLFFRLENQKPVITSVEPTEVRLGHDQVLTVTGHGWVQGARLNVAGNLLEPTLLSDSVLRATLPGQAEIQSSEFDLRVENPSPSVGPSEPSSLLAKVLSPVVTEASPAWVFSGSDSLRVTLWGADFHPDAQVRFRSERVPASFRSAREIELSLASPSEGRWDISVVNPSLEEEPARTELRVLGGDSTFAPGHVAAVAYAYDALLTMRMDGSDRIARDAPPLDWVDAAPDDRSLVYASGGRVRLMDPVTGAVRPLLRRSLSDSVGRQAAPVFSPDGEWIYFDAQQSVPPFGYVVTRSFRAPVSGRYVESLPRGPAMAAHAPAPSTSGDHIAFLSSGALAVVEAATGELETSGPQALSFRWSPDDKQIAYLTPEFELKYWLVNRNLSRSLAPGLKFNRGFDWLPDGMSIIAATRAGDVVIVDLFAGSVELLPELGQARSIAWYGFPESGE